MENDVEDQEMIKKIANGSEAAFTSLLLRYKKRVYGTCFYLMGDQALAEDMSQETWIRVVKGAPRYRPLAPVISWILRISRNLCLNELRTRNRWESFEESEAQNLPDEAANMEGLLTDLQNQNLLQTAMLKLPASQRAALMMVTQEDKSHAEIALELDCSVGAVKVLLHRARKSLQKELEGS